MSAIEDFKKVLSDAARKNQKIQTVWAEAVEVDESANTMTAKGLKDGLEYYLVVLGFGAVYQIPKPGSRCLLGMVDQNEANTYLIHCTDAERLAFVTENTRVEIRPQGITLERNGENLKHVHADLMDKLGELCDAVNQIVVTNGLGPNVLLITAIKEAVEGPIKTRLNDILL